jgi:hypothetical protein
MAGYRSVTAAAVLATAAMLAPGVPALAADATARAVAAVRTQGDFIEIGPYRALFMGALQGTMYIETGPDDLDGSVIVCPVSFVTEGVAPDFTTDGYCTIARGEEHKVYARWSCAGTVVHGCRGRLTLTGGTGRFTGISGDGDLHVRMVLREFPDVPGAAPRSGVGLARQIGTGLVVLPTLRYRLP